MKLFLSISLLLLMSSGTNAQNYNWITPNTTYLKLSIIEDGVYRLTKNDFTQAGVITSGIDPRTVKIIYKGNEQPVYFEGEQDGSFEDNDFLDFYAVRNFGGSSIVYREVNQLNVLDYMKDEYYNQYSDTNVYWISWGGSFGMRMNNVSSNVSLPAYNPNYYLQKIHLERDEVFTLGQTANPFSDFRYFNTERVTGEGWFWRLISNIPFISLKDTINSAFFVSNLSSGNSTMKIWAIPNSRDEISNNFEHGLEITINGSVVDTIRTSDFNKIDTTITFSSSVLVNGNNSIRFRYTSIPGYVGTMYFDYAEISYPRSFSFLNEKLSFETGSNNTDQKLFTVQNLNSSNPVYIYDVNNNERIINPSISGSELKFSGKENGKFEVVNKNITLKPFRVIQRSVPDLISNTNGSDYLIIYNKLFTTQAEQLRAHRESHDNYRSVKTEIEDIYDIFNYGIEDPVAVKNFVKHVYQQWQSPKVKYVCLFGRGSLDPKKIKASSEHYQNLIPVYGNPPTDGYFVRVTSGSFTYVHDIAIGRLPAYSVQEAQDIVSKIIDYDNTPPEEFWKTFLFITGGKNASEQSAFQSKSNYLINTYILPPLISGDAHRIYRNDSSGYITYNYKDSIRREFNRGAVLVNFIGHAASQDWEIGLENPNDLNNNGKLPLVLSMTCFTGKNSESEFRSFGEKFLYLRNKCAIGFIGSTGWSFSSQGNDYNEYMLRGLARDSIRNIGEIIRYASKIMGADTINSNRRNTINSYNLIGDPATKLHIPPYPEFDIRQNDYKISNLFPAAGEKVHLTIKPRNLGTHADTCQVGFQLIKNQSTIVSGDTLLMRNFGYKDSLSYSFTVDSIGSYSLKIILDVNNRYPLELKENNVLTIPITLRNISYIPIKPQDNELITKDSVEFSGLNPNVDPSENQINVFLQLDTNVSFAQPIYNLSKSGVTGVTTKFNIRIPSLDSSLIYYWRTNSEINGVQTGWSEVRRFMYKQNSPLLPDSIANIYMKFPAQFEPDAVIGLKFDQDGFSLSTYKGNLFVHSLGSNLQEASYFIVNDEQIYIDDGQNKGLNIVKASKVFGNIIEFRNFRMTSKASSDSVISFLNTFDTTHILLALKAHNVPGGDSLSENAKQKFREFGSNYVDSLGLFIRFHTWAFISYPENNSYITSEDYFRFISGQQNSCPDNWCPSRAMMNPVFNNLSGKLIFDFGPAHRWKNFSWKQIVYPNSNISFDVFGINRDNQSQLLYENLANNLGIELGNINFSIYPSLQLIANIKLDSNGVVSPLFHSLDLIYAPPADIAVDPYSIERTTEPVQEGDSVFFKINYTNPGLTNLNGVINKWSANILNQAVILRQDTITESIMLDEIRNSEIKFSTAGMRNMKSTRDTMEIFFESIPLEDQNELFAFNNTAASYFIVLGDSIKPEMEITYDGSKIQSGEYIQARPVIEVKFFDDSRMVVRDTSNIKIYKNDVPFPFPPVFYYIPYYINGIKNPEIDFVLPDNMTLQATVIYKPELQSGPHDFRYIAFDNSGNFADSITHKVIVDRDMKILDMYNYPNPMTTSTTFIFNVTGEFNPTNCKIKIYTVAGRLVKEINSSLTVGYNQISWDGRDNDGDSMANGTYLYKTIIEGNSKTETTIKKLVILR